MHWNYAEQFVHCYLGGLARRQAGEWARPRKLISKVEIGRPGAYVILLEGLESILPAISVPLI